MSKYARIVFEEEIPENTTDDEIKYILLNAIRNWTTQSFQIEDCEISYYPYERQE